MAKSAHQLTRTPLSTLDGHKVTKVELDKNIVDIEVEMNAAERNKFVRLFPHRLDEESACFTSIAQNGLAKYRLERYKKEMEEKSSDGEAKKEKEHKKNPVDHLMDSLQACTETFPDLEALLNNPSAHGQIDDLEKKIKEWQEKINSTLKEWYKIEDIKEFIETQVAEEEKAIAKSKKEKGEEKESDEKIEQRRNRKLQRIRLNSTYQKYISVRQKIDLETRRFLKQIKDYKDKVENKELQGLEKTKYLRELFNFQHESSIYSLGQFITAQYTTLFDEGIRQAKEITGSIVRLDEAVTNISDIRKAFQNKMSLYGVRFNSRDPIPRSTIDHIQRAPEDKGERKFLSLKDHINVNNPRAVDEILRYLDSKHTKTDTHGIWIVAKFVAILVEIARTLVCIILAAISFLFSFCRIGKFIDQGIAWLTQLSPTRKVTQEINESIITKQLGEESERAKILKEVQGNPDSYCTTLTTQYISGEIFANSFIIGIKSAWNSIKNAIRNARYTFFQTDKTTRDNIVKKIQGRTVTDSKPAERKTPTSTEKMEPTALWPSPQPWNKNNYFCFLDPATTIGYELAQFVDKPFRHEPLLATSAFAIADTSMAVLAMPTLVSKLGVISKFMLHDLPEDLTLAFTGSEVSESFFVTLIAGFLEWKLIYLTAEVSSAIIHRDIEALKKLLPEMEPAVLSVIGLLFIGWNLKYIPTLTNSTYLSDIQIPVLDRPITDVFPFMPIFDSLIQESEHTTHGAQLVNSLERIFIGVQFLLWTNTVVSGRHVPEKALPDPESKMFLRNTRAEHTSELPGKHELKLSPDVQLFFNTRIELIHSISIVRDKLFKSNKEALAYYDHLSYLFDEHNKAAANIKKLDQQIDKSVYLAKFYNRYCYKGSISIFKIATLFGFFGALSLPLPFLGLVLPLPVLYLVTLAFRGISYAYTTPLPNAKQDEAYDKTHSTSDLWRIFRFIPRMIGRAAWMLIRCFAPEGTDSPATRHGLEKSFAKELAMPIQVFSAFTAVLKVFVRSLGYVFRAAIALVICVLTLGAPIFDSGIRNFLFRRIAEDVNPHKCNGTDPLKPIYAQLTTIAGTGSHYIEKQGADVIKQIPIKSSSNDASLPLRVSKNDGHSPMTAVQPSVSADLVAFTSATPFNA